MEIISSLKEKKVRFSEETEKDLKTKPNINKIAIMWKRMMANLCEHKTVCRRLRKVEMSAIAMGFVDLCASSSGRMNQNLIQTG